MNLSLKRKLNEGKTTNDIEEVTDDNDNGSDDGNDKNMTNEEKEEGTPKWKKDQNPTSAPELPSFISTELRASIDKLKRVRNSFPKKVKVNCLLIPLVGCRI